MTEFLEKLVGPNRPISWAFQFWPVLASSFVCAFIATWFCKALALKLGIVDEPDAVVKTHREPIAYLGGLGMLVGLVVGVFVGIYCIIQGHGYFIPSLRLLLAVLAGGAIACFIGLVDDLFDIRPLPKVLGQLAAGAILLLAGVRPALHHFTDFVGWDMPPGVETALGIPIVIFFVLGATNSLNLLDGLDGLCAGVTVIITVAMLLLAIHLATWGVSEVGDPARVIICLALVGGVCGFLPFNRHPAKIFMGDAGTMLLGFEMAALMILFARVFPRWWLSSIVIFGLPILDTATAIARRFVNKRPLFVADRGHIYDQMIDGGMSVRQAVWACYLTAAGYAVAGLVMSQIRTRYALLILAILVVDSVTLVWRGGHLKMCGLRGGRDHADSGPQVIYAKKPPVSAESDRAAAADPNGGNPPDDA